MLRYMTAGESHGANLMAILDGVPAGLEIDGNFIDRDLKRRMKGYGRGGRMSIEDDHVQISGGIRRGKTIGSPIGLMIANRDFKIDELPGISNPRPGHADLSGMMKFDTLEARDILERASARETAARVAVGAVAKRLLEKLGIRMISHVVKIGKISVRTDGLSFKDVCRGVESAESISCCDKAAEKRMRAAIDKARKNGDTLGGVFEVMAEGVPPGLGSHAQWDRRIDGALARAVMSIPAVKAVSIGAGIESAGQSGSSVHDEISYSVKKKTFKRYSNKAGGVEGGMTNGEQLVIKGFMKPIATLVRPLRTVDIKTKKNAKAAKERADVCAVSACGVVAEAAVAFELASAALDKFGGDSVAEMCRNYRSYIGRIRSI